MKKNISFKMWLSVFFGGIWQFIRNIFSWKNKTPFWRVIWITNAVCIIAVISMFVIAFHKESHRNYHYSTEYTSLYGDEDAVVEEVVMIEEINNE